MISLPKYLYYVSLVSTGLVGADALYHTVTAANNTLSTIGGLVTAAAAISVYLLIQAGKSDSAPTPPAAS